MLNHYLPITASFYPRTALSMENNFYELKSGLNAHPNAEFNRMNGTTPL